MNPIERKPLPTKEQIFAVADAAVLVELCDEIENQIVKIETDLEFRVDDDDWARRARSALSYHRQARRTINRRVADLKEAAHKANATPKRRSTGRPTDCTNALTLEVLALRPNIDVASIATVEAIDGVLAWLTARIDAVTDDRADEIALDSWERDEGFLAKTGIVLRVMRGFRQPLNDRRTRLLGPKSPPAPTIGQQARERLFVDACREALARETFVALWARVDEMERAA